MSGKRYLLNLLRSEHNLIFTIYNVRFYDFRSADTQASPILEE